MRQVVCAAVVLFLTLECISLATSDNAFITNGECQQTEIFIWQKNVSISVDCDCPPNFVALISDDKKPTFCIMLTQPQKWSNICISTGTTDDYYEVTVRERAAINSFLRKANVTEFWISVQRDGEYDPPLKRLPGRKWGLPLDFEEDYDLEISTDSSGNCLRATIDHNYSAASFVNCSDIYPHLCVYKRSTMLRLHCPHGAYTTRYSKFQEHCFSIVEAQNNIWKADGLFDVDSHRKYQLYQNLAREADVKCESTKIQSNLTYKIQQAFLIKKEGNENMLKHAVMRSDGTMAVAEEFDCIAYENKTEANYYNAPELKLNFDRIHKKLLLIIYNGRYLWRENGKDVGVVCYTDGDTELLKAVGVKRKVWPPQFSIDNEEDEGQEIYEMKLYGDFPGYYWCEGHSVMNFTLIKSERVIAQKKESDVHIYSVFLEVYDLEHENLWQKNNLKRMMKEYSQYLKAYDNDRINRLAGMIKGMQVMKIESISQSLQRTRLIVHVAARYNVDTINMYSDAQESLCAGCDDSVEEHYRLKHALKFLFEATESERYHFKGINSTELCLPQDAHDDRKWPPARIGQTTAPLELCLIETSGLPLTRKCTGDRTYGGVWQKLPEFYACSQTVQKHTLQLFNYTEIPVNVAEMGQVMGEIEHVMDSTNDLIPADLFYISKTMDNMRSALLNNGSNNVALIDRNHERYYCDIAGILNRVMYMNKSVVLRSQIALNTTNILLDSTDDIINRISVANSTVDFLRGNSLNCFNEKGQQLNTNNILENQPGTILFKTPRLILLVVDPFVSGISGLAIIKANGTYEETNSTDHSFDLYETRLIAADESESKIMMEDNLEIAAYVPTQLLERISLLNEHIGEENDTSQHILRIVISVYFNDNIFKETANGTILRANGKIISVTIPSHSSDLPGEIPIFIRDQDRDQTSSCGYWNFEPDDNEAMPKWSFGGCKLADQYDGITLCKCSHLTPFSRLCMDIQHIESDHVLQKFIGQSNIFTLDVITSIGSALSLLGVLGIFVTAFLFPTWRQTAHSKILLQLSLAITFEMIIIFLDGPDINYNEQSGKIQCTLLGGSFHYIILVTFMWMLVIAYLQFLRYVKVLGRLRPSRFILKASLLSWGLPLVPVIIFAAVDYTLYHKQDNISDICYPHGVALYYGLLLPIAVIILVNMASFLLIIYYVFRVPSNLTRSSENDLTLSQIRLSVFLFFLLGLPWIFGMMITVGAGKIFSYLFCITAPLQGFILFVYFIIMNPIARKFWCSKCSKSESDKNTIDIPLK
nr:uncharacterized protein LOC109413232 [Aedes albopictus]